MTLDGLAVALLGFSALATTAFTLVFGFTSSWRRSVVGWALMVQSVGLMLVLDLTLVRQILGSDYRARDAARVAAFAVVTVGQVLLFGALVKAKLRGGHLLDD
jgi:hypothetical protein